MKAAPYFHKNVAASKHKVWECKRALGKLKFKRFCWLFWVCVFFLVFPCAAITSLLPFPFITDAVPGWYMPGSGIGWLIRIFLLILLIIVLLIVWRRHIDRITKAEEKLDKANEKLAEDRDQLKKAENGWRTQ